MSRGGVAGGIAVVCCCHGGIGTPGIMGRGGILPGYIIGGKNGDINGKGNRGTVGFTPELVLGGAMRGNGGTKGNLNGNWPNGGGVNMEAPVGVEEASVLVSAAGIWDLSVSTAVVVDFNAAFFSFSFYRRIKQISFVERPKIKA